MNLQQKLEARLNASKFRLLNQNMSKPSLKLTKTDITHYHSGYDKQVTKWPTNPLDIIIDQLKNETNKKIADLGCGQAKLSEVVTGVYSYDKYPINKQIIQADISQTPVADSFFDIAVCCLSFMKNNIAIYIKECNRILKIGGVLYIAELTSRIGDLNKYKNGIKAMGFGCVSVDKSSKYFIILKFQKKEDCKKEVKIELKSYKYKKR